MRPQKNDTLENFYKDLDSYKKPDRVAKLQSFFKTGKGEYGYGDRFLGIYVPDIRKTARKWYKTLSFDNFKDVISSEIHEHRLCAVIMLVYRFEKADAAEKKSIYDFYMRNLEFVNSWDIVDLSAPNVVGAYLFDKNRDVLYRLAKSDRFFSRRVAILSTFFFIKKGQFENTKEIAEMLFDDREDLIHKAVGWMLREIGKIDENALIAFLKEHYQKMPRTMLRYAIEKFPKETRGKYLKGYV